MAKRVLFICIKNTSRSPMAEALLRKLGGGEWEAYSAGIEPGEAANPNAVEVMRELGCDLSGHRPRHVSALQKTTFDFVAKMDTPDIGDLVAAKWMENWDIPDPARGGPEEFRKVRDLLAERVRRMVRP
jgi:arsenate reductase (thioredoxin)